MSQHDVLIHSPELNLRLDAQLQFAVPPITIRRGEHWCLFGGNGAGKTLLAQVLCGRWATVRTRLNYASALNPDRDIQWVSFEEQQRLLHQEQRHDISEFSASARDEGRTIDHLLEGCPDTLKKSRVLAELGLTELRNRGIRYLSSGQLRRALIARAVLNNPALLVLDSPLETVDKGSAARIREFLQSWMSSDNASLSLFRSESQVLPTCTHMMVLEQLQVLSVGTVHECHLALTQLREQHVQQLASLGDISALLQEQTTVQPEDKHTPMICLQGISAAYGDTLVFDNLSWQMWRGDHVLIEGPNGCGKSTLLSLLCGDNHKAYGQQVYLFGRRRGSGESVWDIKRRFGVVSNELHTYYSKGWRVLDVVCSGFFDSVGLYENPTHTQVNRARAWLAVLGMTPAQDKNYQALSFGQQRLILLARAMVKSPDILILDEPCVGLDDLHRDLLFRLLEQIAAQGQTSIVYVSHTDGDVPACINRRLIFQQRSDNSGFWVADPVIDTRQ